MTTVTSLLDQVAAFTKGSPDLLGDGKVFSLNSHPVECDRMAPFPKLSELVFMAFTALIREDHCLLVGCSLVVDMTGDAVDPLLGMLRFHPRLKESRRPFLVT